MSKSANIRKDSPRARPAKGAPAGKPTKKARRRATPGTGDTSKGRSRNGALRNAKSPVRDGTKQAALIELLNRTDGATVAEMAAEAGWQPHSVRGFLAGTVKKKLGLTVESAVTADRGRVYRIAERG